MAIFKKPIFFAENRNAKIILVLSAEDNERHLGVMNDIWKIAQNDEFVRLLSNVGDHEEAMNVLKDLLNQKYP